jgi:hypothetical protein
MVLSAVPHMGITDEAVDRLYSSQIQGKLSNSDQDCWVFPQGFSSLPLTWCQPTRCKTKLLQCPVSGQPSSCPDSVRCITHYSELPLRLDQLQLDPLGGDIGPEGTMQPTLQFSHHHPGPTPPQKNMMEPVSKAMQQSIWTRQIMKRHLRSDLISLYKLLQTWPGQCAWEWWGYTQYTIFWSRDVIDDVAR